MVSCKWKHGNSFSSSACRGLVAHLHDERGNYLGKTSSQQKDSDREGYICIDLHEADTLLS